MEFVSSIARRAYCVEVLEIVVRHVSSASVVCLYGRYVRGMNICPDFVTPTSPKRFYGQSSEPVVESEFGTFRGSKAVFADSKNDHFLIIFVFFHVRIRNLKLSEVVKLY